MKKRNAFFTGTLLLTFTGLLCRLIGFFYRAFLSQTFGAEGMGIYQLLSPVMALTFSLTAAGIQTAVSKFTASETTTHDYRRSLQVLLAGLLLSLPLSLLSCVLIYRHSDFIALSFLSEPRCASLLRIFALSIPFCAVHATINGYFYGIKCTSIPALTQSTEQLTRVGSVYLLCRYFQMQGKEPSIGCAVVGIVLEEALSTLISLSALYRRFTRLEAVYHLFAQKAGRIRPSLSKHMFKIAALASPLAANRITINFLQSLEAVSIPASLIKHGMSRSAALSVYGVLTGMALPLILFPTALVSSACLLLLPVISEADENKQHQKIRSAVRKSVFLCILWGAFCTGCFLLFGGLAGRLLFHNEMVSSFILTLSFICPLLYLSNALSSILHGLGKTMLPFLVSALALGIRLLFVFLLVPLLGIQGYLYGLLASQLLTAVLLMLAVRFYT